jgi:hypothetical protein
MAQDDPVVSAQWLQQHLGQPDIKVKNLSSASVFVSILEGIFTSILVEKKRDNSLSLPSI